MTSETTSDPHADPTTIELFQQGWSIYRKMLDHNFIHHREAYQRLHEILVAEMPRPFRFLDIACGDAGYSSRALVGTAVSHYRGIDFSAHALSLARAAVEALGCPAEFEERDYVDALKGRRNLADVIWVGLSLHHLQPAQKLAFMRDAHEVLGEGGRFLIYEDTRLEDEDRDGWLRRWDQEMVHWTAYTPAEWQAMHDHVHAADFPEAASTWLAMGREAGFRTARQLFTSPPGFMGLYCYSG